MLPVCLPACLAASSARLDYSLPCVVRHVMFPFDFIGLSGGPAAACPALLPSSFAGWHKANVSANDDASRLTSVYVRVVRPRHAVAGDARVRWAVVLPPAPAAAQWKCEQDRIAVVVVVCVVCVCVKENGGAQEVRHSKMYTMLVLGMSSAMQA